MEEVIQSQDFEAQKKNRHKWCGFLSWQAHLLYLCTLKKILLFVYIKHYKIRIAKIREALLSFFGKE